MATTTSTPVSIFQKNRIAIELLLSDTINYVVNAFNQGRTNFTVASAYGQIVFVLENISQLILYYIEDSITELNINTATRANSVYGLARLAGHNPTRAISATGQISIKVKPNSDDVSGNVVVIPNFTKIKCVNNGQTYMVDLPGDEVRVPLDGSKNGLGLNIVQGNVETQVFTGTGGSLQSFSVNFQQSALVDNFHVHVFVNGEEWKQYEGLYDMPNNGKGYMVRTAIIEGIDIQFGNGFFGKKPDLGAEIKVEYLTTNGEAGNLLLANGDEASFQWSEPGFSIFGDEVDLNDHFLINVPFAPDFGTNPEPLALTRIIAPKNSRNFVLANPDSYIIFLEKFNLFSIIDAFANPDATDTTDDKVIYLFLIPDVRKRMTTSENYFNIEEARFVVTDDQKNKILRLVDRSGSKVVGTELEIVDPIISRFVVNVALILYDNVAPDVVKAEVIRRLSDYFISIRRRDRIPRSDIISVIENVDGVDSVNISIISERDEATAAAIAAGTNARSSTPPPPPRIDEFGDIIIYQKELPIIRGGWADRFGLVYDTGLSDDKPSSVNILVKDVVPTSHNVTVNDSTKQSIRVGNINGNG